MAKAIITLEDTADGQVAVTLDFGDNGMQDNSNAHDMAVDLLSSTNTQHAQICVDAEPNPVFLPEGARP